MLSAVASALSARPSESACVLARSDTPPVPSTSSSLAALYPNAQDDSQISYDLSVSIFYTRVGICARAPPYAAGGGAR
eukprot:scaffold363_cov129-Isochrysis_galbana.AAC.5